LQCRSFTEKVQILGCLVNIAGKPEQQVCSRGIGAGVSLGDVRPVKYIRSAVFGYNNIAGIEITMTHLVMVGIL